MIVNHLHDLHHQDHLPDLRVVQAGVREVAAADHPVVEVVEVAVEVGSKATTNSAFLCVG